ncbi:MAG TPA: nicotinamide-nucleotide amidohydrolase family protein [Woeseiaceae bacterium]|nr:nicotinamide-nucleotide amidohydrolase family protein [Woeseiaceae bacterium]
MDAIERIGSAAADIVRQMTESGATLATAESCTGGWIAKAITDVPGSSAVLGYGIVSYSNDAKESLLGVRAGTLAEHGAVSEAVVREMAEGVLALSGADYAVAVSGIAGPGGGTPDKPVGTVWFAWARVSGGRPAVEAAVHRLDGDRDAVRRGSVLLALEGLRDRLADG